VKPAHKRPSQQIPARIGKPEQANVKRGNYLVVMLSDLEAVILASMILEVVWLALV
jgi:hypothetical protein